MLTSQSTHQARVAIEPGFQWDAQDAYLFDIDGTLLRSRDRVHVESLTSSVQRVTGFEVTACPRYQHQPPSRAGTAFRSATARAQATTALVMPGS